MPIPACESAVAPFSSLRWGKSSALIWLSSRLSRAHVPASLVIEQADWRNDYKGALAANSQQFGNVSIAVRSDAGSEDQQTCSNAGRFLTLLDVAPAGLTDAITRVFEAQRGENMPRVLLQPMVRHVRRVGVASTHRISDGAPWYCIELARGDSVAVTAGRATGRQLAWRRDTVAAAGIASARIANDDEDAPLILTLLRELEDLVPAQPFEIEFALTSDSALPHLLQVRPLATARRWPTLAVSIASRARPNFSRDRLSHVVGARPVYSLMSDWNPAELIGSHPRPLALDLFQALIARGTWWLAREALGYRHCPSHTAALLKPITGRPYVDIRRSANSLLPADLSDTLSTRLVDHWLAQVKAQPELHDKVEFDVFNSCRDLRPKAHFIADHRSLLGDSGSRAFEFSLRRLTLPLMGADLATFAPSLLTLSGAPPSVALPRCDIANLLHRARTAAFEFAQLARIAFIAEAQLRSAVALEALSAERALELRLYAGGVSGVMHRHRQAVHNDSSLRPSSFDITQPLWQPSRGDLALQAADTAQDFSLRPRELNALNQLFGACRLSASAPHWAAWASAATAAREWGKFRFSQPLAALIEYLAETAAERDLDRETLSWLTLSECIAAVSGKSSADARAQAALAQQRAQAESQQMLSPVLRSTADMQRFDSLDTQPNFVGIAARHGPLRVLDHGHPEQHVERGDVVAVRHADPGYDWLFERGIAGLLTAWGGAHSHMGIRCAEHGLPAALGCGEAVWAQAQRAASARIDPMQAAIGLY